MKCSLKGTQSKESLRTGGQTDGRTEDGGPISQCWMIKNILSTDGAEIA